MPARPPVGLPLVKNLRGCEGAESLKSIPVRVRDNDRSKGKLRASIGRRPGHPSQATHDHRLACNWRLEGSFATPASCTANRHGVISALSRAFEFGSEALLRYAQANPCLTRPRYDPIFEASITAGVRDALHPAPDRSSPFPRDSCGNRRDFDYYCGGAATLRFSRSFENSPTPQVVDLRGFSLPGPH